MMQHPELQAQPFDLRWLRIAELGIDTAIFLGIAILLSLPIARQLLSWREEASMGFAARATRGYVCGIRSVCWPTGSMQL